jgi:hypothetical protein
MTRPALVALFVAATTLAGSAQSSPAVAPDLEALLTPGMNVWITDSSGREENSQILGVSGDVVTTSSSGSTRRLRTSEVVRVRVRRNDSVLNGALIGAGAAVATGLFLCNLTEPWENCRDDVGPMVRIGAVGAGIGIGVDALIRGRKIIYEATPRAPRLDVMPFVGRHAGGLQLSLSF